MIDIYALLWWLFAIFCIIIFPYFILPKIVKWKNSKKRPMFYCVNCEYFLQTAHEYPYCKKHQAGVPVTDIMIWGVDREGVYSFCEDVRRRHPMTCGYLPKEGAEK
jgi:hypothetical protein